MDTGTIGQSDSETVDNLIMGRLDTGTMHGHWDHGTTRKFDIGMPGRWDSGETIGQASMGHWDNGTTGPWDNPTLRQWTLGQWDNGTMGLPDNGQSDNGAVRQWDNGVLRQCLVCKRFR